MVNQFCGCLFNFEWIRMGPSMSKNGQLVARAFPELPQAFRKYSASTPTDLWVGLAFSKMILWKTLCHRISNTAVLLL